MLRTAIGSGISREETVVDGSILRPRMTGGSGSSAEVIHEAEAPLIIGGKLLELGVDDRIIGGTAGDFGVTGVIVAGNFACRTG